MKQEDMVRALAELDGFTTRSGEFDYDGLKIPYTVWNKGGETHNNAPKYLTSYDAIIPLIQKLHGYDGILAYTEIFEELSKICAPCECGQHWAVWMMRFSPAQLCEALLKATGKWQE